MDKTAGQGPAAAGTVAQAADASLSIDERRARVAVLRERGLSTPAIGRELGCSHETVRQDLKALGHDSSARGRWNGSGHLLSLTRAAERFGVNRHTLAAAANDERVRARRTEAPGLGPNGVGYLFDVDELQEDLERLPACRYDGCDRPALGPSGGCEAHGHVFAGPRARGVRRPDLGPEISAGKIGKPRPDQSERIIDSYRTGRGAWGVLVERMRGSTRRRLKGHWTGRLGGRPPRANVDPDFEAKRERLLELARENPKLGERPLAERSGLSRRQVRAILGTRPFRTT